MSKTVKIFMKTSRIWISINLCFYSPLINLKFNIENNLNHNIFCKKGGKWAILVASDMRAARAIVWTLFRSRLNSPSRTVHIHILLFITPSIKITTAQEKPGHVSFSSKIIITISTTVYSYQNLKKNVPISFLPVCYLSLKKYYKIYWKSKKISYSYNMLYVEIS